jgi:hypothetical protein
MIYVTALIARLRTCDRLRPPPVPPLAVTMPLVNWPALTLTLSPRRGNRVSVRRKRSLNGDSDPALEQLLPLLGERAGVREVVTSNRIHTALKPQSHSKPNTL